MIRSEKQTLLWLSVICNSNVLCSNISWFVVLWGDLHKEILFMLYVLMLLFRSFILEEISFSLFCLAGLCCILLMRVTIQDFISICCAFVFVLIWRFSGCLNHMLDNELSLKLKLNDTNIFFSKKKTWFPPWDDGHGASKRIPKNNKSEEKILD